MLYGWIYPQVTDRHDQHTPYVYIPHMLYGWIYPQVTHPTTQPTTTTPLAYLTHDDPSCMDDDVILSFHLPH